MIKLRPLINEIIAEKMSFADLMRRSDPERIEKGNRIPAKTLVVKSINDKEAWKFSYKSPSSDNTTGLRHQGFIYFFKETLNVGDDAYKIPCSVDCSCPDYKFRFSYANKQQDAGENGPNSLNKGLNYPSSINQGPGLCKHLISLKEYLRTRIEKEPESSPDHQTIQPPAGKPVVFPASPPEDKIPKEEPDEPEGDRSDTSAQTDPTQSPDVGDPVKNDIPPEPNTDPTQTPENPDSKDEDEIDNQLKEQSSFKKISDALDQFCKENPIFIIK